MNRLAHLLLLASLAFTSAPVALGQEPVALSLRQAEEIAIQKHPRITAAELVALASRQATREARSAYFPTITANATAVGVTEPNTRIAAGGLNNPLILDRDAEGVNVSQLITDFGRTADLTKGARLRSEVEAENALATRAQILLEVNAAYFGSLEAQSVLAVAGQTVATRQLLFDQVSELASNNLKSDLDVSFALVSLEEGKLLQANADNDLRASFARLSALLADREEHTYRLVEEAAPPAGNTNAAALVELALRDRPDLGRLRYQAESAASLAQAEHALHYPTISAFGSAGLIPVRDPLLRENYAAAGVNFSLPIFDGMLFSAREEEARLRARAVAENLREAEDNVVRDVRVAALDRDYAGERVGLTAKLLQSATEAFGLAQARYKAGASSIVELSQAQLSQTEAQIANARARFEYHVRQAVLDFQTGQLK